MKRVSAQRFHPIYANSRLLYLQLFLRYMGVPKSKNRSRDPGHDPYWPNLRIFIKGPKPSIGVHNMKFLASAVPEIYGDPKM